MNGLRSTVGGGEGVQPEHRGELPGLSSFGRSYRLGSSLVIDGSYFQTSVEASRPPPVKQNLSKTLGLISLARRLQGPTRVGNEQWSNGRSWDRGQELHRRMYGSIGDMSVSASVSERDHGEARRRKTRRRRRRGVEEKDSSSEGRLRGGRQFYDSDSEKGKESPSEFSLTDASSPLSSITAEHDKTDSDTGTEKNESDSGREKAKGAADKGRGSEREDKGRKRRSEGSNSSASSSKSANLGTQTSRGRAKNTRATDRHRPSKGFRHTHSTVSSLRPKSCRCHPSSHVTTEEDSEVEEESEEDEESGGEEENGRSAASQESSRRSSSNNQSDDSDDLSPIIEDEEEEVEEEEERRVHSKEENQDEERDLGNLTD